MNGLTQFATLLAQAEHESQATFNTWQVMGVDHLLRALLAVCIFAFVGVTVLAVSIWVMTKMVPFSMRKEIEEDQNVALAIIVGAIILGISIIIAASVAS